MLKRKRIIDLGVFLALGFLTITWFRGNYLINHGDQGYPLSPSEDFKNSLYFWNHLLATGYTFTANFANLSFYLFPLLTLLRVPLFITEKVLYYFIFASAGVAVYLLVNSLKVKNRRLIGITTALAYMFNFYPLLTFWSSFINLAFFYASAPLLLSLYVKLLESNKIRYLLWWLFIALFIFSPAATNPGHVVTLFLLHFTYLLFYLFRFSARKKRKKALTLSLNLFLGWLLLNTWWLLPTLSNLKQSLVSSGGTTPIGSEGILKSMSLFTSFFNLFRFFGPWTFHFQVYGDPYFPWSKIYLSFPFIILSFLGPVVAFLSLLKKKKNPFVLYFALLFLFGLFLMKGVHIPFSWINQFIVLKIPYFVVFRNSYEKFGVIALIGYSLLVGFGFSFLNQLLKKFLKQKLVCLIPLATLCFLMFGVYMWPFWTGDLIYKGGKVKPGARMKIPDYYFQAGNWLGKSEEEFKLFSLPHQDGAAYRWKAGYVGSDDPTVRLLQRPIVSPFDPKDKTLSPYLDSLLRIFYEEESRFLNSQSHFLGMGNMKYVLFHNDLVNRVNNPRPDIDAEKIRKVLTANPSLKKEKSFGKLDFYKLKDEYFLPHFYVPQEIVYLQGDAFGLAEITSLDDFPLHSAVYLTKPGPFPEIEDLPKEPEEIFIQKPDLDQTLSGAEFDLTKRVYQLTVPSEGNYQLLVEQPDNLPWPSLNDWTVEIKGERLRPQDFSQRQEGWFKKAPFYLPQGKTNIKIAFADIPNLVRVKDWQPYLGQGLAGGKKAFYQTVNNWQPDSWYQISGIFRTARLPATLTLLEEVKDFWSKEEPFNKELIVEKIALPANKENKVKFYFKSKFNSLSLKLILVTKPDFLKKDLLPVEVKNLQVLPLFEPQILLRNINLTSEEKVRPEISFAKSSPVKYRLRIEGAQEAFPLVFSETFHQGWKLYLVGEGRQFLPSVFETWGKKPIAEDSHYLANGFANSWYLEPEDVGGKEDYQLIVEFTPQRFFYIGVLISGVTLAAGGIFLLAWKFKKGGLRL